MGSAICGNTFVDYCLSTGIDSNPEESEPNTIKQAYALADYCKWREAVDAEMYIIDHFN